MLRPLYCRRVRRVFWVLVCFGVAPVHAEVFRCQQPDGSWLFTDVACAQGESVPVRVQENTALDSRAWRAQVAAQRVQNQRPPSRGMGWVLIEDSVTRERNARVERTLRGAKQKKKRRKPSKTRRSIPRTASASTP